MSIHAPSDESRTWSAIIVSNHVENGVRENKPSDELILLRIVKVEELVVGGNAVNLASFWEGNVDNAVDDNASESNVFYGFVCFFFQ